MFTEFITCKQNTLTKLQKQHIKYDRKVANKPYEKMQNYQEKYKNTNSKTFSIKSAQQTIQWTYKIKPH